MSYIYHALEIIPGDRNTIIVNNCLEYTENGVNRVDKKEISYDSIRQIIVRHKINDLDDVSIENINGRIFESGKIYYVGMKFDKRDYNVIDRNNFGQFMYDNYGFLIENMNEDKMEKIKCILDVSDNYIKNYLSFKQYDKNQRFTYPDNFVEMMENSVNEWKLDKKEETDSDSSSVGSVEDLDDISISSDSDTYEYKVEMMNIFGDEYPLVYPRLFSVGTINSLREKIIDTEMDNRLYPIGNNFYLLKLENIEPVLYHNGKDLILYSLNLVDYWYRYSGIYNIERTIYELDDYSIFEDMEEKIRESCEKYYGKIKLVLDI